MLAATLAFMAPGAAYAQEYDNTPVTISSEKVKVDGKVCYSHIVLERQTLFSISKAYNVSIDEIYKYNPSLKENGLKKNSILIIPCEELVVETPVKVKEEQIQQDAETHHIVKWFEDLDSIAEKYGVSVEAIMKVNGMTGKKLSKRQKLLIPSADYVPEGDEQTEEAVAEAEAEESAEQEEDEDFDMKWLFPDKEVSVSLVLPFKANGTSGNQNNMDFYSGVLLAVNDLAEAGIKTDLKVYDNGNGSTPASREDIESSDIVIGPISPADIQKVMELAPETAAIISPLDPRAESLVAANKSLIQAPVPHKLQYEDLASWIKEDYRPSDKVLVITEKGARQSEAVSLMTAAIDSTGITFSAFSYSILEGRNVTDPISNLMTTTGTNRVMIASESEAFVNDVVRNLNLLIHRKYDIVLYAPSKIRSFETIEVENFHNTKLHVSLGYYIDYSEKKVMDFIMKYRALFNAEPTQFAFQGYDLAYYFIRLCSKDGDKWMNKVDKNEMSMLQSTFKFNGTEDGGHINSGVRRIVYGEGWSVTKVR